MNLPRNNSELAIPLHLQKHFHVNELAELWGASPNTVRRWFENEPGVLKISMGYRRGKDYRVCLRTRIASALPLFSILSNPSWIGERFDSEPEQLENASADPERTLTISRLSGSVRKGTAGKRSLAN